MGKFKSIGCITLVLVLAVAAGCGFNEAEGKEIDVGGKKITVLETKPPTQSENPGTVDAAIEKIDKYAGIRGEDWLSEESILVTKENSKLKPISVLDQMSVIRNLYAYQLKSGDMKSILGETDYMWMPIVSPDGKHIFSENLKPGKYSGLILDLEGNIKASVADDPAKGFHISYSNARWVNNEEVIVPSSGEGVCLINVNSTITKIENIGRMQTDYAEKVGNKIYYISVERNLMAYDISTKKREIVKQSVFNFVLSPNKDMFAIEKKVSESKNSLVLIDLNGNEKAALTEAKMIYGMSWSPDQTKLVYLINSDKESKSGLYIMDLASKKSLYVPNFANIDNSVKWSPASKKILASIGEVKDMKLIDNTYVITLK